MPKLTREQILSLSPMDKKSLIYKIHVDHERGQEILEDLEKCFQSCLAGNPQPAGFALWGVPGAGKTTLLDQFIARHPRVVGKLHDEIPVIRIQIRKPANLGNFMTTILTDYGDPLAERGQLGPRNKRINDFIRNCRTRMIMFDDIHDMLDPGKVVLISDMSDWMKTLIKERRIACVLSGMAEKSDVILKSNEQLGRLFPDPELLQAFSFDLEVPKAVKDFRAFLYSVESLLPFVEPSRLSDLRTAHKIHIATGGLIGYTMELIRYAANEAVDKELQYIDNDLLSLAFRKRLASRRRGIKNPFLEG